MSEVNISEIQIVPVKPNNGLVGFVSFIFNNQLYLGDIAIYTRLDGSGYRLVFPAKTLANGKQINCVHPINKEVGKEIEDAIVIKFRELTARSERSEESVRNGRKSFNN